MPTLTKKQYDSRQAAAPTGWRYAATAYIMRGENELVRNIDIDADHYVQARVLYVDEYARKTSPSGCTYRVETGRHIPALHISYWTRLESGMASSTGLGKYYEVPERVQDKKIYKALCNYADTVTEEHILDRVAECWPDLLNARVL